MSLTKEQTSLYDKIVEASVINLINFTKEDKRKNFYIPHSSNIEKVLYDIEIAKLAAQISSLGIYTITYEVNNFEDFKFLISQKWKMRKNLCKIKKAKKEDKNNNVNFYTYFMNKEFSITNKTYVDIYNAYFNLKKGIQ